MKRYENVFFIFVFFFLSLLVFLSRYIQINYTKKFSDKFYLFDDPIFINPDSYNILNNIKENITKSSNFYEKIISNDFLTSIFTVLNTIFYKTSLSELVLISSPIFVFLTFLSLGLFFYSISNKYIAVISSFTFTISVIFFSRSSSLFFDKDVLNIFFVFIILYFLNFYTFEKLEKKKFFFVSLIIILINILFSYHYAKVSFSLIFGLMIVCNFFFLKDKLSYKLIFLILYFSSITFFYGLDGILTSSFQRHEVYSSSHIIQDNSSISVASTVNELQILSIFQIEKILFLKSFYGLFLILSSIGILFYIKKNYRKFALFLPLLIFSYLTLDKGIRFLIYVAPYIYFGFFYFFNLIINIFRDHFPQNKKLFPLLFFFLIILIWKISPASCSKNFTFSCEQNFKLNPFFDREIVKGIIRFNNLKHDYNIITSLDYGYLINYYTNSKPITDPGMATWQNKLRFFYNDQNPSQDYIKEEFDIKNNNQNYLFLTKDFIKWWPTISRLYSKQDHKSSRILTLNCSNKIQNMLNCLRGNGQKTKINLSTGTIDNMKLIYKVIINSKDNYSEKILNQDAPSIIVYSPNLKTNNLYIIFPRNSENSIFIKYFFSKEEDNFVTLENDNWPNYRTYKIKQ